MFWVLRTFLLLLARFADMLGTVPRLTGWYRPRASLGANAAAVTSAPTREAPVAEHDLEPATNVSYQPGFGWFPLLALSAAVGVAICTMGDALSRSTRSFSQVPFWVGVLIIFVPIAFRLSSPEPRRSERLSLVVLLGLALYFVKVVLDPFGFTFADELIHAHNVNEIVRTHSLFGDNPILSVTPRYPGLESVTAALSTTSGLGTFGAGLIVVGASRLLMMLGLFLLFERVSGSARIAGLGAVIYTANSNFLFFSSQFSYESLALPLLVLVLVAIAEREDREVSLRRAWAVTILLTTCAVSVIHHLTSYALAGVLCALSIAWAAIRPRPQERGPWPFAIFAIVVATAWLVVVASITVGYLTPVLTGALASIFQTVSGESGRQLFSSGATGYRAPWLERSVGIVSILALGAGTPFGLRAIWRGYRSNPFAIVFSATAVGFFGVLFLRFAPGAWETANRASEFLFIGLAFVLALAGLDRFAPRRATWLGVVLTTLSLALVFAGGVIAGWPPLFRVSHPYRVEAGSGVIEPEGRLLARWAADQLGPARSFAVTESDARLLLAYARERTIVGRSPDVRDVLATPTLPAWQLALLRENELRYVAVALRRRSNDNIAGYYFGLRPGAGIPDELLDPRVAGKFDRIRADRVYDSGTLIVYDLERVFDGTTQR